MISPENNSRLVTIEIGDGDLTYIADALALLADVDEGENTDDEKLRHLAAYLRDYTATSA